MKTVIFTDLDGTFLNHNDYSFAASAVALEQVFKKEIPLIFTTSKTKIEVEQLQQKVGVKEPFIVENGAALFIPKNYKGFDFSFLDVFESYYIVQLGVPYHQVLEFYNTYKEEFGMLGFSDMTDEKVMELTGLSIENAKTSKQRNFTEPFVLENDLQIEELEKLASKHHLKITKGGRFYHLIGENQDKGKAVEKCVAIFEKMYHEEVKSIGLGDGQNDVPLLNSVNVPIAIQNHEGEYVGLSNSKLQKSSFKGAKGWNEMVMKNV
ncbi:HAD-IIB family hydrolase [Wenyingzhuangia aestuarii]|uniref:HAD-IIB family hydrolase n=1 Tax=Wenyingzhuangia aestuarii TaxID=1647582 RepID=UPI00143B290E|nr:HAD-IIB family hydrolase [Wenyingzhuangia aestuarii]NJB81391.1 mannosyl-3-phosphoglycerate phosphatase [Wenyingzhuangia aestuarii]